MPAPPVSPHQLWQEAVKTALLGTSRAQIPEAVLAFSDSFASDRSDRTAQFLDGISMLAQMRKANPSVHLWKEALPDQAPDESLQRATAEQGAVLQEILSGNFPLALHAYLQQCEQTQTLMPSEALPTLIEQHWNRDVNPDRLWKIIGARGKWLMRQHSEWQRLLPVTQPDVWETGGADERLRLLAHLRKQDPQQSLMLIQKTWDTETPSFKRKAVLTLMVNPQEEEEAILEKWLDDSRKEVRQAAAQVLGRRASARRAERIWTFLLPYLKKKKNSKKLKVDRNISLSPEMVREGIDLRAQVDLQTDLSGRTLVWLCASIPPSYWRNFLEESDDGAIAQKLYHGVEGQEMILGLQMATERFEDQAMVRAILQFWLERESSASPTPAFVFNLIQHADESTLNSLLYLGVHSDLPHLFEQSLLVRILKTAQHQWSGKYALKLLVKLDQWVRNDPASYWGGSYYRSILQNLAYRADLKQTKAYVHALRLAETLNRSMSPHVHQAIEILKFRLRMQRAFQQSDSSMASKRP